MAHPLWALRPLILLLSFVFLTLIPSSIAFQVPIVDTDYSRQICSGMWGGPSAYINVSFGSTSQGNLAMVIYEWADVQYLGKVTTAETDQDLPQKTYICTSGAVNSGYCTADQLGRFILDLPASKSVNTTSFWSARVELPANKTAPTSSSSAGLWNNPAGNPTPPNSSNTSPWRRSANIYTDRIARQVTEVSSTGVLVYNEPIHYPVKKTGFYCVAAIPVTVQGSSSRRSDTDVPFHPSYTGSVLFKNTFNGQLPATDYPKVNFYFTMFIVYATFGVVWAWFCYRHIHELLPIQYYLSGLVGLLVIEMLANWVYYRYLNAHGKSTASTVFLIVVAILDAGRNSMSFFMLLVVALGLSVVRESLGRTMLKCQALAVAHFIFGILYAIGIVELELESTSALILLIFIIPLAFTLSTFLLWIMYSLNATIAHLRARKQRYKLKMFERLYYILLFTVLVIAIFFVVSTMSFSGRLAEDYSAKTWRYRWWLLDGWLALLYLSGFVGIAFLWRPSANNRR
ncbi:lung seven transmembrane receptor-domain-containing protein [Flammula alnicola]|nr:lung seven transmembrane receptor-domain-containing protein [Flammula alnicola]